MQIIPSIYLRGNRTLELAKGGTIYNEDPLEMARMLEAAGAELLYIVDLDAPPAGHIQHLELIKKIIHLTMLKVQLGGAIRSVETAERYIVAGVERLAIGTIAYQKPDFLKDICKKFPGKIAVPIDVRGGKVVIKGWTVAAKKSALDYARQFEASGAAAIIYSDVDVEGRISKEDAKRIRAFAEASPLPIIHSADVSSIADVLLILAIETPKIIGTIIGRSMYSGAIDIATTITHAKEKMPAEMDEPTLIP